jgi:hypothetical protein
VFIAQAPGSLVPIHTGYKSSSFNFTWTIMGPDSDNMSASRHNAPKHVEPLEAEGAALLLSDLAHNSTVHSDVIISRGRALECLVNSMLSQCPDSLRTQLGIPIRRLMEAFMRESVLWQEQADYLQTIGLRLASGRIQGPELRSRDIMHRHNPAPPILSVRDAQLYDSWFPSPPTPPTSSHTSYSALTSEQSELTSPLMSPLNRSDLD